MFLRGQLSTKRILYVLFFIITTAPTVTVSQLFVEPPGLCEFGVDYNDLPLPGQQVEEPLSSNRYRVLINGIQRYRSVAPRFRLTKIVAVCRNTDTNENHTASVTAFLVMYCQFCKDDEVARGRRMANGSYEYEVYISMYCLRQHGRLQISPDVPYQFHHLNAHGEEIVTMIQPEVSIRPYRGFVPNNKRFLGCALCGGDAKRAEINLEWDSNFWCYSCPEHCRDRDGSLRCVGARPRDCCRALFQNHCVHQCDTETLIDFNGTCRERVNCGNPRPPVSGTVGTPISTREGANVTYRCDNGFQPSRPSMSTCKATGLWTPAPQNHTCTYIKGFQFLQQPNQGKVFIPLGGQIDLSCSVPQGLAIIDWLIVFPSGKALYSANRTVLMQQSFMFKGVDTHISTVSMRERDSGTNNNTNITCIAVMGQFTRIQGNTVQVIFYGAPPPPTGLASSENGLFSLILSWSLGFIEGVPVSYTLNAQNLNSTSARPTIISGIQDKHYAFTTHKPCDTYKFTVVAVTAAGNSKPSQEHTFVRKISDYDLCSLTPPPPVSNSTIHVEPEESTITLSTILPVVLAVVIIILACLTIIIIYWRRGCRRERKTTFIGEDTWQKPWDPKLTRSSATLTNSVTEELRLREEEDGTSDDWPFRIVLI